MPRPRQSEAEKAKRHEVYACEADWAAIKAAAQASGRSVSRYLIALHETAGSQPVDPLADVHLLQKLGRIHSILDRIAEKIKDDEASRDTLRILAQLVALERHLVRMRPGRDLDP